jgi:hypothetical protein
MSGNKHQTKQQILALLTQLMRDSADIGKQDELVFGDELDLMLDNAAAEAVRVSRYMTVLVNTLSRRNEGTLDMAIKALRGTVEALTFAVEYMGRYYGNPSRNLRGASARRVVRKCLKSRQCRK